MIKESEPFTGANVRSHLRALEAQIELIKNSLNEYGDLSRRLKKQITEDLIVAVIDRFEKNEFRIKGMDEKINSISLEIMGRLSQEIKSVRDELNVVRANEERIGDLESRIESLQFDVRERIPQEIRSVRDEISDAQLSKAITSVSEEKEIKVNSKPLDELNKEQELFF